MGFLCHSERNNIHIILSRAGKAQRQRKAWNTDIRTLYIPANVSFLILLNELMRLDRSSFVLVV